MKRLVSAICVSLIGASLGQAQAPIKRPSVVSMKLPEHLQESTPNTVPPPAPPVVPPPPLETPPAAEPPPSTTLEAEVPEWATAGKMFGACFAQQCETPRFTAGIEYLLWGFPKDSDTTTVATDGTLTNRLVATGGDQSLDRKAWSGARLTLGYWWYAPHQLLPNAGIPVRGFEAKIFSLGQRSIYAEDYQSPVVARPFFDLNNRVNTGLLVAAPGFATGGIDASAKMRMWGAEANAWQSVKHGDPYSTCVVSVMGGARYLELDPTIQINSLSVYEPGLANTIYAGLAGNRVQSFEEFGARNRFYGGQVGVGARCYTDCLVFDGTAKLALGANCEQLRIDGYQIRTLPNGTQITSPGALLALPSNIGKFNKTKFSQVPELTAGVTCPVLPNLSFRTEFMALYWTNLLRAREQIDRVIDVTQIPNYPPGAGVAPTGLDRPGVKMEQSDLWVLGVNFSAEFKW